MRRAASWVSILFVCLVSIARADEARPIKAVMFVGGRFHDYKTMPQYLAKQMQSMANITFDIKEVDNAAAMVEQYKDPKFGEGYDVIVYDICFGEDWKDGDYDKAIQTIAAGKPAVFIHCSMHTYRPPRDEKAANYKERAAICDAKWHALTGMDTRVHDKYQPFSVVKVAKDQPIIKTWPEEWKTPGDELYNTIRMMPTATPLLQSTSPITGKVHTVAWINHYGNTRIFSTTLGHDMKTGVDPDYHRLLAYGILWTCDKLGDDGKPKSGYGPGK